MIDPLIIDFRRDKFENRARNHVSLAIHLLTLRVGINLEEFKAVYKKRLQLLLCATLL